MILEYPLSDEERSFLDSVAEFARTEVMLHADQWDHEETLTSSAIARKFGMRK